MIRAWNRKMTIENITTSESAVPELTDSEARYRMVQDNFCSAEECREIVKLTDEFGQIGDGYGGNPHPHTPYETFAGYSLDGRKGDPSQPGHRLALQIMARARKALMAHYQLKFLWLNYGHIVMREASSKAPDVEEDLSHPWHFDNQAGIHRYRSHTAILYLNDDFRGGNTCFREADFGPFRELRPRTGRLVSFRAAENAHAVTRLHAGRRYVFNMWFCTHWSKWRDHRRIFRPL